MGSNLSQSYFSSLKTTHLERALIASTHEHGFVYAESINKNAKVKLFLSAGKCTGTSQECCGFYVVECLTKWQMFCQNSSRSIYLNPNMTPWLSCHFSIISLIFFVLKSPRGIASQRSLEKFAILSLKPRSHDRILVYRTWAKKQQEVIFLYKLIKGKCVCRNYFRHKGKRLYDKKCFS